MKLFLSPNLFTDQQTEEAVLCVRSLQEAGYSCSVSEEDLKRLNEKTALSCDRFSAAESDLIVSLGGDGAVLRAAALAVSCQKPLFGINSGRRGYLCALSYQDLPKFADTLACSGCETRFLLDVENNGKHSMALNDVVLMRESFGTSLDLRVSLNGGEPLQVRGDGVVISTPTGSTAYNYSAGGPILHPGTDAVVITPLYASYGLTRSLIIGKDSVITVSERDNRAILNVDGNLQGKVESVLTIRCSEQSLQLYCKPVYSVPKSR